MNLDKLKIDDHKRNRRRGGFGFFILCLLCIGAGFWIGQLFPAGSNKALKVKTITVRSPNSNKIASKQFVAGGWIEVATPQYPIIITSRVSESLTELNVSEGDIVKPGQILAKLYDEDIKTRLKLTEAEMKSAQKTLELHESGFREEDIREAEAIFHDAQEEYNIAKTHYERDKRLNKKKVISDKVFDTSASNYRQASATLNAAKARLDKMKFGFRKEIVEIEKADLEKAKAKYELAKRDLSYCVIKAPGGSDSLRVLKIYHKVGEWINRNSKDDTPKLISLYDPNNMQVRVDVTQDNISHVKVGGKATISTDAMPNRKYEGTIIRVEPLADISKNTITVKVKIDEPDSMLFPEMIARVQFSSNPIEEDQELPPGAKIPLSSIVSEGGKDYVFVYKNGLADRIPITINKKIDKYCFVDGLSSGNRLIISPVNKIIAGQKVEEEL